MLVSSRALWYNYIQHLHVNVADEDSRRLRDGDGGGGGDSWEPYPRAQYSDCNMDTKINVKGKNATYIQF